MDTYFKAFEQRKPSPPLPYSLSRELLWQFLATLAVVVGGWYIWWRWFESLNYHALWFSVPLAVAETMAYIGMVFYVVNLWKMWDYPQQSPPQSIRECVDLAHDPECPERPIIVDVFFPTYSEEPELVRLSLQDAKRMIYPYPIDIRIHVLDDGKDHKEQIETGRAAMKQVAQEERVHYMTRPKDPDKPNEFYGFKAGNMANGVEHTAGDFVVVCDADTRPFPTFLEHTLGYFRDPDVAWVQTPQWFFDLPAGQPLPKVLEKYMGKIGYWLVRSLKKQSVQCK